MSSHRELFFGADKECGQSANDPAKKNQDDDNENGDERTGKVGMLAREPRQSDGKNVFPQTECNVRNRLGRWGHGGTRCGFPSMRRKRDRGSEKGSD
jgi:hypothetical protein